MSSRGEVIDDERDSLSFLVVIVGDDLIFDGGDDGVDITVEARNNGIRDNWLGVARGEGEACGVHGFPNL